jgi:hypothetical protein
MDIKPDPTRVSPSDETNLLLFPEETVRLSASSPMCDTQQPSETLPSEAVSLSLAHVLAAWQPMLKRLGRRRRILATILAGGRPIRRTPSSFPMCSFDRFTDNLPPRPGIVMGGG